MNHFNRETLKKLIEDFERSVALCHHCCRISFEKEVGPDDLCNKCVTLLQLATDFEDLHSNFELNDSQLLVGFKQATGKQLTEEELIRLKFYMLEYECEDSVTVAEAIKKIVASLNIHQPGLLESMSND